MATTRYEFRIVQYKPEQDAETVHVQEFDSLTDAIVSAKERARTEMHAECSSCAFAFRQLSATLDGMANYGGSSVQVELHGLTYELRPLPAAEEQEGPE